MQIPMRSPWVLVVATVLASACNQGAPRGDDDRAAGAVQPERGGRRPDVIYVPTPDAVVHRMLTMAGVSADDVVYDLGCGDGRIVIAAARDFGARAVGVDIDPQRVREARANVARAGLSDRVEIRHGDMFQVDTSPATVVALYLLESLNVKLRPKLKRELRDGARIVSQTFRMGDWAPIAQEQVGDRHVFVWTIEK